MPASSGRTPPGGRLLFPFRGRAGRRSAAKVLTRDLNASRSAAVLKFRPTCPLTNAVFRQRVRDPTAANGSAQAA